MEKELNLVEFIRNILSSLKKYFWLFALIFLLGLGASWLAYSSSNKIYQTDAVVYANFSDFSLQSVKSMMELINKYAAANRFETIGDLLNITAKEASTIKEILVEIPDVNDKTFFITLLVTKSDHVEKIEQGIINYFNNNKTKQQFDQLKIERYHRMNNLISDEVTALDSVWKNKASTKETDLGLLVGTKIDLLDKKSSYQYTIDRIRIGFSYIQKFNKKNLIVGSLNLKKYLFLGGFAGLIIIGLVLILIELKRALK